MAYLYVCCRIPVRLQQDQSAGSCTVIDISISTITENYMVSYRVCTCEVQSHAPRLDREQHNFVPRLNPLQRQKVSKKINIYIYTNCSHLLKSSTITCRLLVGTVPSIRKNLQFIFSNNFYNKSHYIHNV